MDKPVDVVERVALRVMRIRYRYDWTYGLKKEKVMAVDLDIAKAAIAEVVRAMGEPSEAMIEASVANIRAPDKSRLLALAKESRTEIFQIMLTAWARENGGET